MTWLQRLEDAGFSRVSPQGRPRFRLQACTECRNEIALEDNGQFSGAWRGPLRDRLEDAVADYLSSCPLGIERDKVMECLPAP
jgi:hypothetical protein